MQSAELPPAQPPGQVHAVFGAARPSAEALTGISTQQMGIAAAEQLQAEKLQQKSPVSSQPFSFC